MASRRLVRRRNAPLASGPCPIHKRVIMAQQRIDVVQEFRQPVEEVFAYLADHNNLKKVFGIPVKRVVSIVWAIRPWLPSLL